MVLGIAFLLFDALRHRSDQKAGRIRSDVGFWNYFACKRRTCYDIVK